MEALKTLLKVYANTDKVVSQKFYQGLCEKALERIKELETGLRNIIDESKSKAYSPKIVKSYAEEILKGK